MVDSIWRKRIEKNFWKKICWIILPQLAHKSGVKNQTVINYFEIHKIYPNIMKYAYPFIITRSYIGSVHSVARAQ